ncbi:hypothetical protein Y1Q_0001317 [Alligator mississippiensis]|uniref:Uncharacterized protein n=1 Tax=Alligator mississippiensis TaxID=8496 RepID=A0A151M922_ALLMI|nr:hypothetical protein Y1Q_0001317 [Alligator mississippiensis]
MAAGTNRERGEALSGQSHVSRQEAVGDVQSAPGGGVFIRRLRSAGPKRPAASIGAARYSSKHPTPSAPPGKKSQGKQKRQEKTKQKEDTCSVSAYRHLVVIIIVHSQKKQMAIYWASKCTVQNLQWQFHARPCFRSNGKTTDRPCEEQILTFYGKMNIFL